MTNRDLVLNLLKLYSVKIAFSGESFPLSSGEQSKVYLDVKKTMLHGRVHVPIASLIYEILAEGTFGPVEALAGVALGGCHLASIVSVYASMANASSPIPLHVIYVRKEAKDHGTKRLVERPLLAEWTRVVLLEDVVTTGKSTMAAVDELRKERMDVVGIVSVVDRRENKTEYLGGQIKFRSLFTLEEVIKDG